MADQPPPSGGMKPWGSPLGDDGQPAGEAQGAPPVGSQGGPPRVPGQGPPAGGGGPHGGPPPLSRSGPPAGPQQSPPPLGQQGGAQPPPPVGQQGPPPVPGQADQPAQPGGADQAGQAGQAVTPQRLHAMLHDHQQTRTYPCSQCGGELEFHIGQQQLACPHCGNVEELREATGAVEERDLHAAIAAQRQQKSGQQALVSGEKEIVCQNCGGHTTFTGTLTATRCPYCTTPIQRDDVHAAPERLPVDGVLPFRIEEKQAVQQLDQWVSSRWFAPSQFKDFSKAGSFESIYTAYFTYDAQASTDYTGERGTNYTVETGDGENRRTETRTRWTRVRGNVHNSFDDVAVMANEGGLNLGYIQQLEPWPMHEVKPFSPEFMAGHLSRTYDKDVETCFDEAKGRMESEIATTVRRDIGGDQQRVHSAQTRWSGLTFKHLLLPIWLLAVTFEGQTYQVMINGVTGEVVGERPYSKVKIAATVLAVIAVIVALVVLLR